MGRPTRQLLLAAPLLLATRALAGGAVPPCPCDDPSLCRPLSPQPSTDRDEVVAFSSWVFNGEQPRQSYTVRPTSTFSLATRLLVQI